MRTDPKTLPVIKYLSVDSAVLAAGLQIDEDNVIEAFQDGRVASRFTEHWAEEMFGVLKYKNTNQPYVDASHDLPDGSSVTFAIRSVTKNGIKFQASKFIGMGRTCLTSQLRRSINETDRWLVFDIRNFPEITAIQFRSAEITNWIDRGFLTPSGLSPERFDELIKGLFSPPVADQLTLNHHLTKLST